MEVTLQEARDLLPTLAWTWVQSKPWFRDGVEQKPADPHQYVIKDREVPVDLYWAIVRLIKREGFKARYAPPYRPERPMVLDYLEIGEWVHWAIPPVQICRTKIAWHQAERLPEQTKLEET